MSEISRRDVLRNAAAAALAGCLPPAEAQHVHQMTAEESAAGPYKPKAFTDHEFATVRALGDLIIPADEHSPAASAGGAAEFIDLLSSHNEQLKTIWTGGVAWLDSSMRMHHGSDFVSAAPEQQTELLTLVAYRENASKHPEIAPGVRFFGWARKMVVDAFYTSKAGIEDVGYRGNVGMGKFHVPQEAIDYALKRSPV